MAPATAGLPSAAAAISAASPSSWWMPMAVWNRAGSPSLAATTLPSVAWSVPYIASSRCLRGAGSRSRMAAVSGQAEGSLAKMMGRPMSWSRPHTYASSPASFALEGRHPHLVEDPADREAEHQRQQVLQADAGDGVADLRDRPHRGAGSRVGQRQHLTGEGRVSQQGVAEIGQRCGCVALELEDLHWDADGRGQQAQLDDGVR